MKKKTVSLILAMMLLVTALSGCGGTGASSKPENNATEAAADAGEKTEAAEPVQESAEPVQEAAEPVQEATEPAGEGTKEDVQFAGGSGTAEDPWQIATAEQLDRVRDDLKAHYVLTDDIDLSGYENWIPMIQSKSTTQRTVRQIITLNVLNTSMKVASPDTVFD